MDRRHELAWAAGFFDGEGWANRTGRGVQARINQAGVDGMPQVLIRFQRIVGVGRLKGPDLAQGSQPLYHWEATSRLDIGRVSLLIGPFLAGVKRRQFAATLSDPITTGDGHVHGTEALAWLGGFYDGEGSASMTAHRSHEGHFSPEVAITQLGHDVPEVLIRVREALRCGRIYGPYEQEGALLPIYRWKAHSYHDVHYALYALLPWIGEVKRAQAARLLRVLVEQGRLPRGNPAWGNRKTHCLRGHEYANARIRPYRSRGKAMQRRASQQCLVCVRDQAREKRAQIKDEASDE